MFQIIFQRQIKMQDNAHFGTLNYQISISFPALCFRTRRVGVNSDQRVF